MKKGKTDHQKGLCHLYHEKLDKGWVKLFFLFDFQITSVYQ